MKQREEIEKLATALTEANKAAKALENYPDGGTCCMDSPTITLDGWRRSDIDKACAIAGVSIEDKMGSSWWKNSRFVRTFENGMASRRMRQAEVAVEVLRKHGFSAAVFYMMD